MSDVVDEEVISVSPTAHIKVLKRVHVIFPERFVPQEMARVAVVGKAEGVLEHQKSERLLEDWSPVNFFVETLGVLRITVGQWSRACLCTGNRRKWAGGAAREIRSNLAGVTLGR